MQPSDRAECPEPGCNHVFRGNGWDGIDAHWRAHHESIMPYEQFWATSCDIHRGGSGSIAWAKLNSCEQQLFSREMTLASRKHRLEHVSLEMDEDGEQALYRRLEKEEAKLQNEIQSLEDEIQSLRSQLAPVD